MDERLRILHLEDDPMDAELIRSFLKRDASGCDITCVQTRAEFEKALQSSAFDLILSDFSGPEFDGMSALRSSRDARPETPFIFVSGSIGEDAAIESLRGGATDYVLKQRLKRLGPAVVRAVHEAKERKERKLLEEKFLQAQKMEVVGQLAGGIAHDFNNLLAVILGHIELLLERKDADPRLLDSLRSIHLAAESAGSLTKQLLLLSRRQGLMAKVVDVNATVASMARMLSRILGPVRLRTEVPAEPLPVMADAGMLEQVIMNLVVNARDAMPEGGTITVRAAATRLGKADASGERRAGDFVRLSVEDTGTGIPPEVLPRLFDPFFTTKAPGKGTGLGLSTVYGIVHHHYGWIEVESRMGLGSSFHVFLPASEEPLPQPHAGPAPQAREAKSAILIVEGDARLRKQARAALEDQGYEVLEAAKGPEALALAGNGERPVNVLLTDVILADGTPGRMLAESLAAAHPGLKTIYTSRYGLEAPAGEAAPAQGGVFLQKPYERQSLLRTVRLCLEAGTGQPPKVSGG